jgi:hypothetical protein
MPYDEWRTPLTIVLLLAAMVLGVAFAWVLDAIFL